MRILIFALMVFTAVGCTESDDVHLYSSESSEVNTTEIAKGALYGNGEEGIPQSNHVIINNAEWQNLMSQMNAVNNVASNFSETEIDFDNYMVLAIFLEVKEHGWQVEINSILENETQLTISTEERITDNTVMNQPYHIVKMSRTEKQIIFE